MVDEKTNVDRNEDVTPPSWLDAQLMQRALHLGGERNLQVGALVVRAATAPGDNYASVLYRVTVKLKEGGERSLLVKTAPPGEFLAAGVAAAGFFRREASLLGRVVPEMEALFEEATLGPLPPLAPRCPLYGNSPAEYLVLEDLAPLDFKMADRHRGLGLRHCLIALRALARFHAASVALLQKDPSISEGLENPWRRKSGFMTKFAQTALQSSADACRTWPGYEGYAPLLEALKSVAGETFRNLNDPQPNTLNVIVHGDFWTNNVMFRYQDGQPQEMRMLDFQITHISSPAIVLLYFLTTSPSDFVAESFQDLLLREYHHTLADTMQSLSLQPPPLEALLADVDAHGTYAVFAATSIMPLVKTERPADFGASMAGDPTAGDFMFKDPAVVKCLRRVIPEYKRKGWLPG